ncbi:MAG: glycosyltransferase [Chthoniobacterales bacterium]|nr:glycosyltransferase [Chthoniobacterales bacterium]
MEKRADLHLHTRHSARATDWLLRKVDFPASCSDPMTLYRDLRGRGFEFVTFTDYDTIDGCLEIAGEPGAFISEEITAVFPEDEVKVHLLAWGINERQHREIQGLRGNIYELAPWLKTQGIAHAVAHPFWPVDERLSISHWRRLVLLFRHFETVNGLRDPLLGRSAEFALSGLTPERIAQFADAEKLQPLWDDPWKKAFTGGSDDKGGIYQGRAWTESEGANAEEFLAALRDGHCRPGGQGGGPLIMAHSLYSVIFEFAGQRLSNNAQKPAAALLEKMAGRFMEGKDPTRFTLSEKLGFLAQGIATGKIWEIALPGNASLWKELADAVGKPGMRSAIEQATAGIEEPERRAFLTANLLVNQLAFRFFSQFIAQLQSGRVVESLQFIGSIIPLALGLAPYFYAFRSPGRGDLAPLCEATCGEVPEWLRNRKRVWFTDTLEDVNGVSTTIRKMTAAARAEGFDLTVATSRGEVAPSNIPVMNFKPVGEFELPEYELQKLSFPPVLEIIDWIQREGFTEVVISTPGPIGLCALLAAKTLGVKTAGIYHTDFPQYVRILTDDSWMETLTWNFMQWFYEQMDTVFVNSEDYRKALEGRGIKADRIHILPRGLDTELFHPSRRDTEFWKSRGLAGGEIGLLYAGRVSKEKKLDLFAAAVRRLRGEGLPVRGLVVGHGPYSEEFEKSFPEGIFTGYLSGEELAKAYASADVFVFPSTTDTFGNVILEAQAAALPCVVSDQGGPRELVGDGVEGFVTRGGDLEELCSAVRKLCADETLRRTQASAARRKVEDRSWPNAARKFWAISA